MEEFLEPVRDALLAENDSSPIGTFKKRLERERFADIMARCV